MRPVTSAAERVALGVGGQQGREARRTRASVTRLYGLGSAPTGRGPAGDSTRRRPPAEAQARPRPHQPDGHPSARAPATTARAAGSQPSTGSGGCQHGAHREALEDVERAADVVERVVGQHQQVEPAHARAAERRDHGGRLAGRAGVEHRRGPVRASQQDRVALADVEHRQGGGGAARAAAARDARAPTRRPRRPARGPPPAPGDRPQDPRRAARPDHRPERERRQRQAR